MEITIFRKNEITQDLFTCQETHKTINYSDINSLKNEKYGNYQELDDTKCKIDLLDRLAEKNRRAAAKYLHEYELVKILCKKQVLSRAYFKLYEMVYGDLTPNEFNCFFICEAPGGFIECICDIRRKKNLQTKYISISKRDQFIKYGSYLEENNLFYGDITDLETINNTLQTVKTRFPNGLEFITADGGFDVKNFLAQEILCSKLILCEIYLALSTQKTGGRFIIKFFDMFSHNSIIFYLLLCSFYNYVKIIKPKSSRNCNSERYLICYDFKGKTSLIDDIYTIIENFEITENKFTVLFPNFNLNNLNITNLKKLTSFNNIILHEQIKTINESIKIVQSKNSYIQNLLLNIFIDKTPENNKIYNVLMYKNILSSRINKCIEFLKSYFIHIHKYIK